jgi:HK97 family phage portal protein
MTAWETMKSIVLWKPAPVPVRTEQRDLVGVRPIQSTLNRPQWPKRDIGVYNRDAYGKLALIFRCVQFLSQSVASAPLRVYPMDEDDPDDNNPLRQLLTSPNRESNEARFLSQVTLTMAVAGFCVIEKERSTNGRVVGLWPINPAYCKPIPRADASPDWEIVVPGYRPVTLFAEDVIALTYADRPDQNPTGIGPLEVLLRQWGLANVMDEFIYKFFQNDALPQYVLVPKDGAIQKQADADVARFKWRQFTGLNRADFGPPVMESIADVKRIGFDLNELAYKDIRDITENAICQAFGIPPILLGTTYGLERSTFANYGEARRSFYEDTISPMWNRVEDAFGRGLFFEFTGNLNQWRLNFDTSDVPAMRDDVLPRQTLAVTAFQAGGLSSHQLADELGIEPRGPDVFMRSIASMDLPVVQATGRRFRVTDAETFFLHGPDGSENRRRALALPEVRQRIGLVNRTAYLRVAQKFEPQVQTFFDGQAERVAAVFGVRSQNGTERRDVAELVNWDEEDRLLGELLRSLYQANGQVAFQLAGQSLGDDSIVWTVQNPRLAQFIERLAERVVGINATTKADISRIVTEALLEGVTMPELAGRLDGLFEETYAGRAMTISRTESQVAYNQASTLAYAESGVVEQAELLDNPDHTDDYGAADGLSCAERNGLIVDLADVGLHIESEHPNGTLAVSPYLAPVGDA